MHADVKSIFQELANVVDDVEARTRLFASGANLLTATSQERVIFSLFNALSQLKSDLSPYYFEVYKSFVNSPPPTDFQFVVKLFHRKLFEPYISGKNEGQITAYKNFLCGSITFEGLKNGYAKLTPDQVLGILNTYLF